MDDIENSVKKIYADLNGTATFVCPHCGNVRKEQAALYKDVKGPIAIECNCGQTYSVQVEFRKFYRKETRLEGIYATASSPSDWIKVTVKNVSLEGCGFETVGKDMLQKGVEIKLEFKLDDAKRSLIRKRALVLSVFGRYVGCKFKELPGAFDPDLGFYLRK
ncbi:MAG: PilZ domain-containing protein [Deltaproteobacteria bacterium]|nr:PilZ domain-containing protein [Deltaproteobacteria bacterium]